MYTTCAHNVVAGATEGINGTIFCYGQTGAGKTFTMSGEMRNYNFRGVIPRAIHDVFREVDMKVDKIFKISVSYLEIYNEELYDLLAPSPASPEPLVIIDDERLPVSVKGMVKVGNLK